jgi:hypothetical protein
MPADLSLRPLRRLLGCAVLAVIAGGAQAAPATATSVLFVGNSFTYGDPAGAAAPLVKAYRPDTVTDLNGSGIGGVPALFKTFTEEAGLRYEVSLETMSGAGLNDHYDKKLGTIAKPWDLVLLQSYSTLDAGKPGNPDMLIKYSGLLANAFHDKNPKVRVMLNATWSRADQTWKPGGAWYGKPITQMALDVRRGYDAADAASRLIDGVIPVGEAWNRAIAGGLADPNPYDGITAGQINLWAPDSYHGSVHGYYLEALTIFGAVTGKDPRALGASERAARELGIDPATAMALQNIAATQLAQPRPH